MTAPVTLTTLQRMKRQGEKIACLTCYDAGFTRVLERAGVDMFIIGDSLGMVLMGYESTLPVSMDDMVHHAASVARVGRHAWRVVDMPYRSYESPEQALENARRLIGAGGAHMVKLEGGTDIVPVVACLRDNDIPCCGHVGLLPQSVEQYGGYKVQGRDTASARGILEDARALEAAGVGLLVMECIPSALAAEITRSVRVPTIGIGAGPACDGQVLVLYDMLGITHQKNPRFVKDFLRDAGTIPGAVEAYIEAVKSGAYPAPEHEY
ncbi:MAG: 3-methyl-2-oxobutanoate hydroxymethyltransferase [Gammaproteobacteria bacterium]